MKLSQSIQSVISIALAVLLCALSVPNVFADVSTSTNFAAENQVIDAFGGTSTSTSFSSVSAGDAIIAGDATSTSFQITMGPLYFDSFAPLSQNWRWFDDAENETPTAPFESENVAPSNIGSQNLIKLRVTIKETSGTSAEGNKFKLQYSTSSDFSTGAYDLIEDGSCAGSSTWCYADGAGLNDAVISTSVLSDADACAGAAGDGCGTHNESGTNYSTFTQTPNKATEYEFTIKPGAVLPNTVYFFRVFYVPGDVGVPLQTGASYPSLSTSGSALTFSIAGVPSATTTEGVTTDVDTSETGIPFGALPIATTLTAAQRLSVSTNATQGYEIYAYQRQGLLADNGAQIDPVSGTNAAPSAWTSGCSIGAAGCYGYHAGDDVLSGGSTRFAADDTYAQFSSSPSEIAYSAGPVTDRITDVVYRLEARSGQDAGSYSSTIVYILVPTF